VYPGYIDFPYNHSIVESLADFFFLYRYAELNKFEVPIDKHAKCQVYIS